MFSKRIRIIAADGAVTDKPVFKLSAARATDALIRGRLKYIDESTAQLTMKDGETFDERTLRAAHEDWEVRHSSYVPGFGRLLITTLQIKTERTFEPSAQSA